VDFLQEKDQDHNSAIQKKLMQEKKTSEQDVDVLSTESTQA